MAAAEGSGTGGTLVRAAGGAGASRGLGRGTGEARLRAGRGRSGTPLFLSGAGQPVRCRAKAQRGLEARAGGGLSGGRGWGRGRRQGKKTGKGTGSAEGRGLPASAVPSMPRLAIASRRTGRAVPCLPSPPGTPELCSPAGGEGFSPVKLVPEQPRCVPGPGVSVLMLNVNVNFKCGYSGVVRLCSPQASPPVKHDFFLFQLLPEQSTEGGLWGWQGTGSHTPAQLFCHCSHRAATAWPCCRTFSLLYP